MNIDPDFIKSKYPIVFGALVAFIGACLVGLIVENDGVSILRNASVAAVVGALSMKYFAGVLASCAEAVAQKKLKEQQSQQDPDNP